MTMRQNLMRATAAAALALTLAPVHAQDVIKIGEINSYTGLPAFTIPYRQGWQLALEEINAEGGVIGCCELQVVSRDDAGRFMGTYVGQGVYAEDPFHVLDQDGVGELLLIGVQVAVQVLGYLVDDSLILRWVFSLASWVLSINSLPIPWRCSALSTARSER